jgi:hypothetical protein
VVIENNVIELVGNVIPSFDAMNSVETACLACTPLR